jgi:Membrane protease subunits, stomatin/prohibitin homologs
MSSDGKEPGSWHKPTGSSGEDTPWIQPPDYLPAISEEGVPPQSEQQQDQDATPLSGSVNNSDHNQQAGPQQLSYQAHDSSVSHQHSQPSHPAQPVSAPNRAVGNAPSATPVTPTMRLREFLHNTKQYIVLIVVPLLFAGLSCTFTLPRVAAGQAVLSPIGFWPLLIILLAVMIAQSVAVYYAGEDSGLWALSTGGGFSLFVLLVGFAIYGPLPGVILLVALVVIGIVLTRRALCPIPDGYVAIVYSNKKYARTLYPGFNILLPWEKVQQQLSTEEIQWISPVQIVQLSREDDVRLRAIISYQLLQEDANLAISQVRNWEESLRTLFQTTLQEAAATFTPDDFLIWPQQDTTQAPGAMNSGFQRRDQINGYIQQLLSDRVALWGVQVNWVSLSDIELLPHGVALAPAQTIVPEQPTDAEQAVIMSEEQTEPMPVGSRIKTIAAKVAGAAMHTPQLSPTPHTAPTPVATPKFAEPANKDILNEASRVNEEVLINAYKAVQNNKITDPETIRRIASEFDAVAHDPIASQKVSFDPARAALNLFEQARQYDEHYANEAYQEQIHPDWLPREPNDENLTTGG